jgi:hypothetical protein
MGSVYRHSCLEKLSESFNLQKTYTQSLSDSVANVPLVPTVADKIHIKFTGQNVPSAARVNAGAFGFLTLIQVLDGPERYGAFSFFETMPSGQAYQCLMSGLIALLPSLRFLSYKLSLGPHFNSKMLEMLENLGELLTSTLRVA